MRLPERSLVEEQKYMTTGSDLTSPLPIEWLKGVEKAAYTMGHSVILCNTELESRKALDYLQLLYEKQIDGIIYASYVL